MSAHGLAQAQRKMTDGGVHPTAIDVFSRFYGLLESGETGVIPESGVDPLTDVPHLADLDVDDATARDALAVTAVVKLNGGLGTSMGMDRAKSLLRVRDDATFLDVIAGQVLEARRSTGARLPLVLMNSFRTRDETLAALASYPDLAVDGLPLDFVQNREPKLRADDLTPVEWPADPDLEWCPPGHGDLYTALHASGVLDALLDAGFRYATVSNSDNLGASPDARIAGWFARTGAPFAAEVARRTPADRKGGHLVVRRADGRIVLRESAQTPPEDAAAAGDIERHRYFNTNNLWLDLRALRAELDRTGGVLDLPLIRNEKTVDPSDKASTKVVQVESAMGAAIEVFDGAAVLEVDRSRFLPVKTTNDLLVLRSDVYRLEPDHRLAAQVEAPFVDLDDEHYKTIAAFDARVPATPSLVGASSLRVRGDWTFGSGVVVTGDAVLDDPGAPARVPDGARVGPDGLS
ncbi:UTP--glucose-1-phosphate uridylyltransferase [Cellulomonas fimi]|uniref:UTP--glucose-1-phosphate uridylyltransferase n=1 Tax=Cellulomonas fimi (strain ATCC 484 / DSM 20113 / JCM 1341 / CCUG 24087 / LMG 16345 / NBRC 15513 / NCIMB 8980 / NCTC 7547 / NRS-133) TaxID=590998 RepID=F4GZ91_CELFA|nr:UTP--glucose-1-phosphate uridylyltransferase [Cellulomonas fimi]AEE47207.1 UTP--glucose-1-phosphate uridylyltransferase [Cellulomonas fimi ATCC 484]NNH08472.1 UTP--glucose-1-phosphate uridylyltransferase [Cellulomonas fimi]VEH35588.1 UTP--glucose-1-phosphate uridylyltransferase [Cellulomonas fimi]